MKRTSDPTVLDSQAQSHVRAPRRSSRRLAAVKEAWITDPEALLTALATAEQAAREAEERARHGDELRLAEPVVVEPEPEPRPVAALPALREDERIGRPADRDVIVIIRRRRAA
jgi:hypothetical protein